MSTFIKIIILGYVLNFILSVRMMAMSTRDDWFLGMVLIGFTCWVPYSMVALELIVIYSDIKKKRGLK